MLYPPLIASMEWLLSPAVGGSARVGHTLRPLTERVAAAGRALGFAVPERHADHIVGLYPAARHPSAERLVERLEGRGIHVAARWGAVRVSPYLYNSAADVERLCAALAELVAEAAIAEPAPRL